MNILFRQGIISAKSNAPWAILDNYNINIFTDSPIQLAFSEADTDYLVTETSTTILNAWTLDNTVTQAWLYWDIDKLTGSFSRNYTLYNPFIYEKPLSPDIGQMYYDISEYRFKEWDGQFWNDVLRVMAASYDTNGLKLQSVGNSQVGIVLPSSPDYIVYGINKLPIYNYNINWYTFYNKSTIKNFTKNKNNTLFYDNIIKSHGNNTTNLQQYRCVCWDSYNTLKYADPTNLDYQPAFAIIEHNGSDNISNLFLEGFLSSNTFNWTTYPNTPLYVGTNGVITTEFSLTNSFQKIGYIVNNNTIYVSFDEVYIFST